MLSVNWSKIHKKYNYVAFDKSGHLYAYVSKPIIYADGWKSEQPHLQLVIGMFSGCEFWKESLQERV